MKLTTGLIVLWIFIVTGCKSGAKVQPAGKDDILRLTYDVAWFPSGERLLATVTNKSQGVTYEVKMPEFRRFRLSSYAEENRLTFQYLFEGKPGKIIYDLMENRTNAYLMNIELPGGEVYLRWEWYYNGKGIVIEALAGGQPEAVHLFQKKVHAGLKVYD